MSLRSFRLVCKPQHVLLVEDLLRAEGYVFAPEPFSPLARKLLAEPLPLGASLAARFGYLYIQDRSSMLPPLALAPGQGASVLDMCASPGSKTGLLGQLVGEKGFVLGNEPSKNRLATLRRNLQTLNLFCCATCSHPGERLPLPAAGEPCSRAGEGAGVFPGWSHIQLDPPCSGWGTVEKHPQVMRLWQGDKVQPLIALQRRLLTEAARLLRPGGRVAYSTCTTNIEENEAQVRYARDTLGLAPVDITPPEGFAFAGSHLPDISGVLRVDTGEDGQGFFVALLEKPRTGRDKEDAPENGEALPAGEAAASAASAGHAEEARQGKGFFVRPWEKESRFVGERRRHAKGKGARPAGTHPDYLPLSLLEEQGVDTASLPDGCLAVFSGVVHFLPEQSSSLPGGFSWKGFVIGKAGRDGGVQVQPSLHRLMPEVRRLREAGLAALDVDDLDPLYDLLKGQSLSVEGGGKDLCLYFRGLPLCRLTVKGKRAVLPPL